jgi:hypothetical protein
VPDQLIEDRQVRRAESRARDDRSQVARDMRAYGPLVVRGFVEAYRKRLNLTPRQARHQRDDYRGIDPAGEERPVERR